MKKVSQWTWELLQSLVALVVILVFSAKPCGEYQGVKLYHWKNGGGMSLGKYIFLPRARFQYYTKETETEYQINYIKHEYGHSVQSSYLGPLYLFVIGLPSLIWAGCFESYRQKNNVSYYAFYTESWADKLGGAKHE